MTNSMVAGTMAATAGGSFFGAWYVGSIFAQQAAATSAAVTPMDKLTEFGLAGSLMAVIVYIVYLLLNRTLSGRETDLAWHRDEMTRRTSLFQNVIDEQAKLNERNMGHIVDKLSAGLDKVETRLTTRTEDILKILETMRSVNVILEDVKDILSHCNDVQQVRIRLGGETKQGMEDRRNDR